MTISERTQGSSEFSEWVVRLRLLRPMMLVFSDVLALACSLGIGIFVKAQMHQGISLAPYAKLWPFTVVFIASYWMSGLYSILPMSHPEELQRGAACSCCIFLSLSAATLSLRGASSVFTLALAFCLLANLIIMPLFREVCRHWFSLVQAWDHQAVIFGSGSEARRLIERSRTDRGIGLRPVAVVDPASDSGPYFCGLPIAKSVESIRNLDTSAPIYAILTVSAASSDEIIRLIDSPERIIFSRIVLVSNPSAMSSMWAVPRNAKKRPSSNNIRSQKNAIDRICKRILDIVLASLALVTCLPVMVVVAIAVKLDSNGPVLFGHRRLGKGQRYFKAWKFRTMKINGDEILAQWFSRFPSAKEEWHRNGKLHMDPRVTAFGRFLRSFSLDELPQLWNVLCGHMSLVGPRPIVDAEVHHYGEDYCYYSQVHGGVTGLWQVSGRSDTTYAERVMLDAFYVSNWSIWLDIAILFRTFGAVLLRRGAV